MIFNHKHLGLIEYCEARKIQEKLREEVESAIKAGRVLAYLLSLEHYPVITFGKNSNWEHLLVSQEFLEKHNWQLVNTDRGGEVTLHAPGQVVFYFIAPLNLFDRSVRKLIDFLVGAVIEVLYKEYGVLAKYDSNLPGVWVEDKKIAAIGVRVKNRISLHGVAININNDLENFKLIRPCGILGKGVTSLSEVKSEIVGLDIFRDAIVRCMSERIETINAASEAVLDCGN